MPDDTPGETPAPTRFDLGGIGETLDQIAAAHRVPREPLERTEERPTKGQPLPPGTVLPPDEIREGMPDAVAGTVFSAEAVLQRVTSIAAEHGCPQGSLLASWLEGELAELGRLREREEARTSPAQPELAGIAALVAARSSLSVDDLRGSSRVARIAQARHSAMALARALTGDSQVRIGEFFGGRDHSTVSNGLRTVLERVAWDKDPAGDELRAMTDMAHLLAPGVGSDAFRSWALGGSRVEFEVSWYGMTWIVEAQRVPAGDGAAFQHFQPLRVLEDRRAVADLRGDDLADGARLTEAERAEFDDLANRAAHAALAGENVPRGTAGGAQ